MRKFLLVILFHLYFLDFSGQYISEGELYHELFIGNKSSEFEDWVSMSNYVTPFLNDFNFSLSSYDVKSSSILGLRSTYVASERFSLSLTFQFSTNRISFIEENSLNPQSVYTNPGYMKQFNARILARTDYEWEKSPFSLFGNVCKGYWFIAVGGRFKSTKVVAPNNSIIKSSYSQWIRNGYNSNNMIARIGGSLRYWSYDEVIGFNFEIAIKMPWISLGILYHPGFKNSFNPIDKAKDKLANHKKNKQSNSEQKEEDREYSEEAKRKYKEKKEAEKEKLNEERAVEKAKVDKLKAEKDEKEWYENVEKQEKKQKLVVEKKSIREAKEKAKADELAEELAGDDYKIRAELNINDKPYSSISKECIDILESKNLLVERYIDNWVKTSEFFPRINVEPTFFRGSDGMLFNYAAYLVIKENIGKCDLRFRRLLTMNDVESSQNNVELFENVNFGRIRPNKDSKDNESLLIDYNKDVAVCWTEVTDGVDVKTVQYDIGSGTKLDFKFEKKFYGFSILTVPDLSDELFDVKYDFFQLIKNDDYVKTKVLSRFERKMLKVLPKEKTGKKFHLYVENVIVLNNGKNESFVKILNGWSSIIFYKFQNKLDTILQSIVLKDTPDIERPLSASSKYTASIMFEKKFLGWEVTKKIISED